MPLNTLAYKESSACNITKFSAHQAQSIIVALQVMLKQVNFYHTNFHDTTLESQFEPWIFSNAKTINLDSFTPIITSQVNGNVY